MRIGPNDLVTNDAELLRKMWAVRSPYRKGPFYQAVRFDPTKDNLISMRDDDAHNVLRAKMATGVSRVSSCHFLSRSALPRSDTSLPPLTLIPPFLFGNGHSWRSVYQQIYSLVRRQRDRGPGKLHR